MADRLNKLGWVVCICLLPFLSAQAVELDSLNRESKYVVSILQRSEKIVNSLNLSDKNVRNEVTKILANRYFELNDIYEKRDVAIDKAKKALDGNAKEQAIQAARYEADASLYRSHFAFPATLAMYLDDKQIDGVKDGMTYSVLHVTYKAQLDMIPTLKEDEKAQIYAWLIEARELAIDAESSGKKHEVFGKYKGRINNYLSKRGYDLTKEREAWKKRVKARGDSM